MKIILQVRLLKIVCILLVLLTACATATPETPTPVQPTITPIPNTDISTPVPPTARLTPVPTIEVTFDGNECAFTEPAVMPEGEYLIIFNGLEGKRAADFYVQRIDNGKTYQDIVDLQGGVPGNYYVMPDFITYATKVGKEYDSSTGDQRITYSFEEGEYYIDAFKSAGSGWSAWLCGSFTIVAE